MALADYLLRPVGLAALASVVPLVLLYLLRPKPRRLELPTMRFLFGDEDEADRSRVLRRLQRDWLILVQLLILIVVSLAIAAPYVAVAEERVVDERVVVVDASASMAAVEGGTTRFGRAVELARDAVAGTTSIVVAEASPSVALRAGPGPEARRTLDSLAVTHADGDLADAVDRASAVAGEDATVVVVSDFVDDSDWRSAVAEARARGLRVDVRPVGRGVANVGIVDVSFAAGTVTATVENFGTSRATRTITLGGREHEVALAPGDSTTVQFAIPARGGELRLEPGDAFVVDDRVPIAAPADTTVDVLLLTNDENRFLTIALSLIDDVSLTVRRPPTTITQEYDLIVFSNVEPQNVLPGNIETAEATLGRGGGVVIQAQRDLRAVNYRGLLLIEPIGLANGTTLEVSDDPLTRGIDFPAPERYVTGDLRDGRALVTAPDGTPIVATAARGGGQVLYYGFIEDASSFKYHYKYPVFWQRAVFFLADRQPLSAYNRRTGTTLEVGDRSVRAPDGPRAGPSVALDRVGVYTVGDQPYAAALLDRSESNVSARQVTEGAAGGGGGPRTEQRTVPYELTPFVAALAVLIGLVELVLLRRRGDL